MKNRFDQRDRNGFIFFLARNESHLQHANESLGVQLDHLVDSRPLPEGFLADEYPILIGNPHLVGA